MADLDDLEEVPPDHSFSPQDYAECLLQLHDIVCTPGYQVDRLVLAPTIELPQVNGEDAKAEWQEESGKEERQDSAA